MIPSSLPSLFWSSIVFSTTFFIVSSYPYFAHCDFSVSYVVLITRTYSSYSFNLPSGVRTLRALWMVCQNVEEIYSIRERGIYKVWFFMCPSSILNSTSRKVDLTHVFFHCNSTLSVIDVSSNFRTFSSSIPIFQLCNRHILATLLASSPTCVLLVRRFFHRIQSRFVPVQVSKDR